MSQFNHHPLFSISEADVQHIALSRIGRKLSSDELERVQKGIEFGLECWECVVISSIEELKLNSE